MLVQHKQLKKIGSQLAKASFLYLKNKITDLNPTVGNLIESKHCVHAVNESTINSIFIPFSHISLKFISVSVKKQIALLKKVMHAISQKLHTQ